MVPWKSLKEFMVGTQEEGPCHIELSPRGTGGPSCKNLPNSMLESVTNARGMPQISINHEEP